MGKLAAGAAFGALLCGISSAAYAQETSASVHGDVVSGGAPVSGASVVVVHVPSGTRLTTATGSNGGFDARGLRVGGPYRITVTAKGAPPQVLEDVFLPVGKTTDVTIDMAGANDVEELVVTGSGTKDTGQGPRTVLTRKDIQEVVTITRDPRDLARRDMLVAQDALGGSARLGVNSGGISIAGSNPRYNRIAVDGVSANDTFGLNQGGMTTARGPVNLDAIDQFAVSAVPTDVENGDFVGGALNLVLRSGTNNFHGAAFVNYLNDGMVGRKIEGNRIPSNVHQKNYGAFLSGPIFEDKLFFALSYEKYQTVDVTQFGFQGAGAPNAFLNNGTQATMDSVVNAYNNGYASKFDLGGVAAVTPFLDRKYSGKVDWNIMEGQRLSVTYRYSESSSVSRPGLGSQVIQLDSQNYKKFDSDEALTFELHSNWSDALTTTFKVTSRSFLDSQTPPSGQNYADVRVCTAPTSDAVTTACPANFNQVYFGPDQFRHANALSSKELRLNFTGEYALPEHVIKFGGQARRLKPLDLFVAQSHGIYYFDSLADFQAGRASRLQYTNSVTGNPVDAQFSTTYWIYSGFAQDTWQVSPDLKVTAGFRGDFYHYPDSPIVNPNFLARQGYANTKTLDGQHIIMPRASVDWEPTSSIKLSAGGGLFSGGVPDVLSGSPFYNTGYTTTQVDISRTSAGLFADSFNTPGFTQAIGAQALNGLNTDPNFGYQIPALVRSLQQGTLIAGGAPQISPTGSVIALSPNYKLPAQWKLFLSGQWDVYDGWRLGADFVANKVQNDITFTDARSKLLFINGVQQFLPDGRLRYDGLGAAPGKTSNGGAATNGGNDIIEGVSKQGHSYTAALTISKSWDWGGAFSAGYAHQKLRDRTAGLFFGTTAGSLYNSVPAGYDPNNDYLGRSVYEIKNRGKIEFDFHKAFWDDNETRISLFAEVQSGRPFGFTMSDATSGRSPVFGVTRTAQALYVPDFAGDTNPNDLQVGIVKFANQNDLNNFKRYVTNFNLPNGKVLSKYSKTNAPLSRVDLSVSQEFPTLIPGHKIRVQADIRNVLNLLNQKWGQVAEYNDLGGAGTSNIQLARVQCADAAGAAVTSNTNSSCVGYIYSQVPTSVPKQRNSQLSLWYMQVSLRYEF